MILFRKTISLIEFPGNICLLHDCVIVVLVTTYLNLNSWEQVIKLIFWFVTSYFHGDLFVCLLVCFTGLHQYC